MKRSHLTILSAQLLLLASSAMAQHYPSMTYSTKQQLAPGVTYQTASQSVAPAQRIFIFEIDMTNPNVELRPIFKMEGNGLNAGGTAGTNNETTSSMARRSDAIAAINAGYYNVTSGSVNIRRTNSYTLIDGVYIGGSSENANLAENGRSIFGVSGNRQVVPIRSKMTGSTGIPTPTNANWPLITDAIAGRGHFTWDGTTSLTNFTVDNEGTTAAHYDSRNPRTAIGYSTSPYRVYMVAIDGRTSIAAGMTYTEMAKFMADLGVEQSISLDGGGSTTAWSRTGGVLNVPSDGSERAVVSAWAVVTQNTMDNSLAEVDVVGTWTTDTASTDNYHVDHLVAAAGAADKSVNWSPTLGEAGEYRVYAWWSADPSRSTEAAYEIVHAQGTATVTVDQQKNGGRWNLLGNYPMNADNSGGVTLRSVASGTVSADAIRFVRHRDTPPAYDTEYEIISTVFETDFETDQSSNFQIAQHTAGDNSANFNYDYTTFAQQAGGFPDVIPAAPNSTPGATKALRVATNLTAGAVNGITATLNSSAMPSGLSNMRITFDAWINYNGRMNGGTGSTEFMSFGASADASRDAFGNSVYTSTNRPFSGFFFAITGEGGAANDYRYYDGNGGNAIGNNATRVNYMGTAATEPTSFVPVFPLNPYETNGMPSKSWHTWEILALNGQLRLSVIKPDGSQTILANWFTPNGVATLSNLRAHLGTFDPYSSLASPASDNFVLYDNLKVQSIQVPASTSVPHWMYY